MEKKKSEAWKYFKSKDESIAICDFCFTKISYKGGSTTNLMRHLTRKHPSCVAGKIKSAKRKQEALLSASTSEPDPEDSDNNVDELCEISSVQTEDKDDKGDKVIESTETGTKRKKLQSTLTSYISKPVGPSKSKILDEQLARLIAMEYQPLSLVEDKEFKKFVELLNPNYKIPSRSTLRNSVIPQLYAKTERFVKENLINANSIALTTDCWTSINTESYCTVTAHFITEDCKLQSFLLNCSQMEERHTAENLYSFLEDSLNKWGLKEKLGAIVTDNAFNISAAVKKGGWNHIACFAHSLNLVVQKGLSAIHQIQIKVKSVVEFFKRSPQAYIRLKNFQKQMGYKELKLKQCVPTRWNSTYDMFQRVVEIKEPLMSALAVCNYSQSNSLSQADFEKIENICKILKPFKDITDEVSCEKHTSVSKVILFKELLENFLRKKQKEEITNSPSYDMCQILLNEMSKRFQQLHENDLYTEATFLDPRFKKQGFYSESVFQKTHEKIIGQIVALITKKREVTLEPDENDTTISEPDDSLWKEFDLQVSSCFFLSFFHF